MAFVYFISLKQHLRPLGYCAACQDNVIRLISLRLNGEMAVGMAITVASRLREILGSNPAPVGSLWTRVLHFKLLCVAN